MEVVVFGKKRQVRIPVLVKVGVLAFGKKRRILNLVQMNNF